MFRSSPGVPSLNKVLRRVRIVPSAQSSRPTLLRSFFTFPRCCLPSRRRSFEARVGRMALRYRDHQCLTRGRSIPFGV